MTRSLVILSLLLASTSAFAADFPNLVGTWRPDGGSQAAALFLPGKNMSSRFQKPIVSSKEAGWTFRIDTQDGAAFAGVAQGPEGREKPLARVIRPDGKRFIYATDNGSGDGEINGGTSMCAGPIRLRASSPRPAPPTPRANEPASRGGVPAVPRAGGA